MPTVWIKHKTDLHSILPGEKLTLYYSDLLTHSKNRLWVTAADT